MARRANPDAYSTVESSVVDELTEILADAIRLHHADPLIMDVYDWREVCQNLPRIAHLVAGRNGFKLDSDGEFYERPSNYRLRNLEREVPLDRIKGRIAAVIHSLDPAGVLWTMKSAA